jgi:ATP-dependent RNA helicase DOB1
VAIGCTASNSEKLMTCVCLHAGSLIRCFRRLGELLRQMAAAARVIGNDSLEKTFEESLKLLERTNSIIFSPSLYL